MRLEIEAFGDKQLSRDLLRVGQNAADMRPAFDMVHDLFLEVEDRQFATQGVAYSGGWRPIAPATVARKARLGLDLRILHETLRLRRSLTSRNHADHVYRASADEMFVGTRVPYAGRHQNPSDSWFPRRRPIEFNEQVRSDFMKILQRHVLGGGL